MVDIDWHETRGTVPDLAPGAVIYAQGRYGDVYGPLPAAIINLDAWRGNMYHASHDLFAWAPAGG